MHGVPPPIFNLPAPQVANFEKKLAGRLPLSDRPFAFLVTPKLPLCGRSEKSDGASDTSGLAFVNEKFGNLSVNVFKALFYRWISI